MKQGHEQAAHGSATAGVPNSRRFRRLWTRSTSDVLRADLAVTLEPSAYDLFQLLVVLAGDLRRAASHRHVQAFAAAGQRQKHERKQLDPFRVPGDMAPRDS